MRGWVRFARGVVAALVVSLCAAGGHADTHASALEQRLEEQAALIEGLQQRLEDLERERSDRETEALLSSAPETSVGVFDAAQLDLGGFLTQTLSFASGADESAISPNQTLLELLLRAQITERTSVFAALGWLREADLDLSDPEAPFFRAQANRTPQIIAWANHRFSDALSLRVGRFVTPHGIINIEHFPPTLLEINQPQFLRPFPGATLFPDFLNGVELHGTLPEFDRRLRYSLFGGVFSGAPEDWSFGGRLAYEWTEGVRLGINASGGSREAGGGPLGNFSSTPVRSLTSNDYHLVGLDFLYDRGRWIWKSEAFFSREDGEDDRLGFYTQPAFRLNERWIAFYRYDYLDPGQGLDTSVEHVLGLNYLPHPLVRLRGAVFLKDFRGGGDTTLGQLSATLSF